jgi:hypothetical protein
LRAAQDRPDARDELAAVEGLCKIIVGAHFEPDDPVDLLAFGGQENDRRLHLARAQIPADGEPVFAWQHDVENDKVYGAAIERASEFRPVGGETRAKSFALERASNELADLLVVVDDEDMR